MTLRNVIIALCGALVITAIVQLLIGWAGWLPVGGEAAIILALLVFERSRYKPAVDSSSPNWRPTGERFEDATSGKTMQVFENPKTGERDYRPTS
jgi:hypothetical protein